PMELKRPSLSLQTEENTRNITPNGGLLFAWKQIRWNDSALPSPPTFFHVSAGNECGQPHGRQSRANSRAEKVFVRNRCSTCESADENTGVRSIPTYPAVVWPDISLLHNCA
ncbi:5220_t:CDS:2, partial [Scutellospora calospora]